MNLNKYIKTIDNFPKEGISFKDISPLLSNPDAYRYVIKELSKNMKDVDIIVAPDARGFLFGPQVALELGIPFVMIRKPGKLPGEIDSMEYKLEYGTNTLEINKDIIKPGSKVGIVDDLLAIGGTAGAIIELVKTQKAEVVKAAFVIELIELNGKNNLGDIVVTSLLKY